MQRITKAEHKELQKQFPPRYFHATKHHDYVELRPCVVNALKILRATACIVLVLLMLTACKQGGTIYADNAVTVFREGRNTTVIDTLTGEEYHFTTRRVKRPLTAVCKPTTDTDTVQIMLVRDEIIIREKTTGKTVCIR